MSLENRVEKLERQTGVGVDCPVCDYPTTGNEINYDTGIWMVGDKTDLRFTDPKGVIVGLYAKGKAKQDASGFVVRMAA